MTMAPPLELRIGDRLRLRKRAPVWQPRVGGGPAGRRHRPRVRRMRPSHPDGPPRRRASLHRVPRARPRSGRLGRWRTSSLPPRRLAEPDLAVRRHRLPEPRVRLALVRPGPEPAGEQHGARRADGDGAADHRIRHRRRRADPDLPRPGCAVQHARRRARRAEQRQDHHARDERRPGGRAPSRSSSSRRRPRPPTSRSSTLINFGIAHRDRDLRAGRADLDPAHRRPPQPDGGQLDLRPHDQRHLRDRLRLPRAARAQRLGSDRGVRRRVAIMFRARCRSRSCRCRT